MGAILAKFRKKKSTYEILESLETKINEIEEYKNNTELQRKKIVGHLILCSVGLYVVAAVLFYFFFFPATLYDQIFYITPLLIFPIIIVFVKRLLTWYYNRKIRRNQTKLVDMKQEKKKLLDQVMDTETYKVAKGILEKFAPEQLRKSNVTSTELVNTPLKPMLSISVPRQRALQGQASVLASPITSGSVLSSTKTPMPYNMSMASKTPMLTPNSTAPSLTPGGPILPQGGVPNRQQLVPGGAPTSLPMPRTILPRERTVLDKMVEYLVGDGPSNRFALICKSCKSHNGMALREEFEYIAFRCCYCYTLNPARKLRPIAPKLELEKSPRVRQLSESTSDSERNSPSDSESEIEEMKVDPKQVSDTESTPIDNNSGDDKTEKTLVDKKDD